MSGPRYCLLILFHVFLSSVKVWSQTTTMADNGTQVSAANVVAGTSNHVLSTFRLTPSSGTPNLTQVTCVTAGTYQTADVSNLKLWYSTDANFDLTDQVLATLASPGTAGTKTFNGFTRSLTGGVASYFFISVDISSSAVSGRTMNINALGTTNFTVSVGSKAGSASAAGSQTIVYPAIALADNGTQVGAANVAKGTTDHVLIKISLAVTTADATLTGLQCTTTGTYQTADISTLKVRYSTDATLDAADATLSTHTSFTTAGTQTFPSFSSQSIANGSTGYIFITADITTGSTTGRTIAVSAITTSQLTFAVGTKSGSCTGGGTQTIFVPNLSVGNNGTQITAASVPQGTFTHVVHKFTLTASGMNVGVTGVQCVTAGTYASADLLSLKLRYSTDATLDAGDATWATITTPGAAGTKSFTFTSKTISNGATGYLFITADIYAGATPGNTLYIQSISGTDITISSGTKGANSSASGTQTITGYSYSNSYIVTSTADAGAGSLREAIGFANGSVGRDLIIFDLNSYGAGPYTISLTSSLSLTDNSGATIHGWSNNGNNGTASSSVVFTSGISHSHKVILTSSADPLITVSSNNNVLDGMVFADAGSGGKIISISGNSNQVLGSYIGMSSTGTTRSASNATYGVYITGANNLIGNGTAAGANLISGMSNYGSGIYITGAATTGNEIKGNIIGLQKDGATKVTGHYQLYGVYIASTASFNNTIGGTGSQDGNVISGQYGQYGAGTKYYGAGIMLTSTAASGNNVYGNRIGIQCNGTYLVSGNTQYYGILISNSRNNTIGGNTSAHRNVISGNGPAPYVSPAIWATGICIVGASSSNNTIKGNYIGLTADGTSYVRDVAGTQYAEQFKGIRFNSAGASNQVGGTGAGDGNVISGNRCHFDPTSNCGEGRGIVIYNTSGVSVYGNIIGLQADGNSMLLNGPTERQYWGIEIDSTSHNNVIGGNTSGHRNILSGNQSEGVAINRIYGASSSTGNLIKGNYIGLQSDGATLVSGSTQARGISFDNVSGNTIGGTTAGDGNVISGHTFAGIDLGGASTTTIIRNIIGLQADGVTLVASGSQDYGIYIDGGSSNIVGSSTTADKNIISGNTTYGIMMRGSTSSNTIKGNYIGPGSGLTAVTGSAQYNGIYIFDGASSNTIGGSAADANVIAYNTGNGVEVYNTNSHYNKISYNPIYSNSALGKPILLNYGANQGNDGLAKPVITVANTTTIAGTGPASARIEIFKNSTGGAYDAVTYVDFATANGAGNWSKAISASSGDRLMVTATDGFNNTSEFSDPSNLLPVELIAFNYRCLEGEGIQFNWTTASEQNNDHFTIERSDGAGVEWVNRGTINGAGSASGTRYYSFTDPFDPDDAKTFSSGRYYRLVQTDFDGKSEYFAPVAVSCETENAGIDIFPNPNNGEGLFVNLSGMESRNVLLVISDVDGRETYHRATVWVDSNNHLIAFPVGLNLRPGIYLIKASSEDGMMSRKLIVR